MDKDLIKAAQDGDDMAYVALVDQCLPIIKKIMIKHRDSTLKYFDTIDDGAHEFISMRIAGVVKNYKFDYAFSTYLGNAVKNFFLTMRTKAIAQKRAFDTSPMNHEDLAKLMPHKEENVRLTVDKHIVAEAVHKLKPLHQTAVKLYFGLPPYDKNMTSQQMYDEMGISNASFYKYLRSGLQDIRDALGVA